MTTSLWIMVAQIGMNTGKTICGACEQSREYRSMDNGIKQVAGHRAASLKTCIRIISVLGLTATLTACGSSKKVSGLTDTGTKTKFTPAAYGVKASPVVAKKGKSIRKGGGRYSVGKPYKVKGKWYRPKVQPNYNKIGIASWYGPAFHGRLTANGEIFDQHMPSAAHPTLPLPSYVRVTNQHNGRSIIVRVNDRGPFAHGRLIDLSSKTADLLDIKRKGTARVRVQYIGRAPLNGDDTQRLLASYRGANTTPMTMMAFNRTKPAANTAITGPIPAPAKRPLTQSGTPIDMLLLAQNGQGITPAGLAQQASIQTPKVKVVRQPVINASFSSPLLVPDKPAPLLPRIKGKRPGAINSYAASPMQARIEAAHAIFAKVAR